MGVSQSRPYFDEDKYWYVVNSTEPVPVVNVDSLSKDLLDSFEFEMLQGLAVHLTGSLEGVVDFMKSNMLSRISKIVQVCAESIGCDF